MLTDCKVLYGWAMSEEVRAVDNLDRNSRCEFSIFTINKLSQGWDTTLLVFFSFCRYPPADKKHLQASKTHKTLVLFHMTVAPYCGSLLSVYNYLWVPNTGP